MVVGNSLKLTAENLKEVKLLSVFATAELSELLSVGQTHTYEPYANIIIEGEASWGIYFILDGIVGVFKENKIGGNTYDIGQLTQGAFFGEMSLVDDSSRSASVRAVSPCTLFYISKEHFLQFLSKGSDRKMKFYEGCVKNLVARLKELDDDYVVSQYQLWQTAIKTKKKAS